MDDAYAAHRATTPARRTPRSRRPLRDRYRRVPRSRSPESSYLAVAASAGAWLWRSPTARHRLEPERPLIAVRPFSSLSADAQQGYFAAGHDRGDPRPAVPGADRSVCSVGNATRRLQGRCAARGARAWCPQHSSTAASGSKAEPRAGQRGAGRCLPTSKRCGLINYDRELADVLAVQSDIALQIARALQRQLCRRHGAAAHSEQRPTDERWRPTRSICRRSELTQFFDRARRISKPSNSLRKALVLDPRFAAAQAQYRDIGSIFMGYYDAVLYIDNGHRRGAGRAAHRIRLLPYCLLRRSALDYGIKGMEAQARQAFLSRARARSQPAWMRCSNFSIHELNLRPARRGRLLGTALVSAVGEARATPIYHLDCPTASTSGRTAETRTMLEEGRAPVYRRSREFR